MLLYAWRNTDSNFNATLEMGSVPPRMVNNIQFEFDAAEQCQRQNCTNHAFVKCAHCGRLICSHHFLDRVCSHRSASLPRAKRFVEEGAGAETCDREEECEEKSRPVSQKDKIAETVGEIARIMDAIGGADGLGSASSIAATGLGLAAILGMLKPKSQGITTAQDLYTTPALGLDYSRSTRAPETRKKDENRRNRRAQPVERRSGLSARGLSRRIFGLQLTGLVLILVWTRSSTVLPLGVQPAIASKLAGLNWRLRASSSSTSPPSS